MPDSEKIKKKIIQFKDEIKAKIQEFNGKNDSNNDLGLSGKSLNKKIQSFCPSCNATLGPELVQNLHQGKMVICEHCGQEISPN